MGGVPLLVKPGQPGPLQAGEFVSQSQPSVVTFGTKLLTPPSGVYLQRDDQILMGAISGVSPETVTFTARVLRVDGVIQPIQDVLAPTGGRVYISKFLPLVEGFLLSAGIAATSATVRGQTFARMAIQRAPLAAGPQGQVILADYLTINQPIGWPGSPSRHSTEGPGRPLAVGLANPAPGADFVFTPTTNTRWRIESVRAILTTSGAAGNRAVRFQVNQGGNIVYQSIAQGNQIAGVTQGYSCATLAGSASPTSGDIQLTMPPGIILSPAFTFQSSTSGILGADQWSVVFALVEEWLDF